MNNKMQSFFLSIFLDVKLRYAMGIKAEISECMQGGMDWDKQNGGNGKKGKKNRGEYQVPFLVKFLLYFV